MDMLCVTDHIFISFVENDIKIVMELVTYARINDITLPPPLTPDHHTSHRQKPRRWKLNQITSWRGSFGGDIRMRKRLRIEV